MDRPMSKSPTITKSEKKLPPIHPGKILLEDMQDEQISINGLAQAIRVRRTASA
jgi:plasmid maintenance system antidote protein VapI